MHFLVQNTESPTHDRSVAALGIPSVWPLAITKDASSMLSRAERSEPHSRSTIDTTRGVFFQAPNTPTHPPGCWVDIRRQTTSIALASNGRDGICGTGRPTGIQDPGKDWESRAARVMYFCTRLPKPNSYRSHQLSPEIPTPLAPAEASCLRRPRTVSGALLVGPVALRSPKRNLLRPLGW